MTDVEAEGTPDQALTEAATTPTSLAVPVQVASQVSIAIVPNQPSPSTPPGAVDENAVPMKAADPDPATEAAANPSVADEQGEDPAAFKAAVTPPTTSAVAAAVATSAAAEGKAIPATSGQRKPGERGTETSRGDSTVGRLSRIDGLSLRGVTEISSVPAPESPVTNVLTAQLATQIVDQNPSDSSAILALAETFTLDVAGEGDSPLLTLPLATSQATATGASGLTLTSPAQVSTLATSTIETSTQLAAQIARRLEGRSTRFEMALTPDGLGRVDVSLDIDADGGLTARLAFDNPLAATELRGRADELRRQLQDAGFTVGSDALSFSEREAGSSNGGNDQRFERHAGRAFAGASRLNDEVETAAVPPAWISHSQTPSGVDLKV